MQQHYRPPCILNFLDDVVAEIVANGDHDPGANRMIIARGTAGEIIEDVANLPSLLTRIVDTMGKHK